MSFIDASSCECARSELELFDIPPTQTSIEEYRYEEFNPITSLDKNTPIEFKISAGRDEYLDLSESFLHLKARILDDAGRNIPPTRNDAGALNDTALVFPINYFINTCFSRVECYVNSKQIGSSDSMYAYRAYLESLLSDSNDVKMITAESKMFYRDRNTLDDYQGTDELTDDSANIGAYKRFVRTRYSQLFEGMAPIHNSLFQQKKMLLPNVLIYLKFHRNNTDFVLMAKRQNHNYRIEIEKASLMINIKRIASHVRVAHEEQLLKMNAKYPMRKVEIKFFTRGANRADLSEPNLVTGVLPKRVFMGMVSTDAFNGDRHKNPFNFQDFGIQSLVLRKNGMSVPFDRMTFDFDNNEYIKGYFGLLKTCDMWNDESTNNGISMSMYKHGHTLFGFNLSPDSSLGENLNLITEGHLSFDLRLKAGHTSSITIICYLEYDTMMEITANREIINNE